jgi:alkaline phosphatase
MNEFSSRRHFIKGLAATAIGAAAAGPMLSHAAGGDVSPVKVAEGGPTKARNLIFMVSDGMNHGTLSAAQHWLKLREGRNSEWMTLYQDRLAVRRLTDTAAADSLVTDSAAASSAWGIGQRVNLGSVNCLPSGATPMPLAMLAKKAGKKAGMVTTARITHATPAGFAANVPHRDEEDLIAEQYLERGLDVLLGGGGRHFDASRRKDGRDLFGAYRDGGYEVVQSRVAMEALLPSSKPLLGVFSKSHIPYWIDRQHEVGLGLETPSLESMTRLALERLSSHPEGFVLQVEAGRVDHAGHANDPASLLFEQLEFDRCIRLVRDFAQAHPDTVVVVTTDHGTGGFMINGAEDAYHLAGPSLLRLGNCRASLERLGRLLNPEQPQSGLVELIRDNLGVEVGPVALARMLEQMASRPITEAFPLEYVFCDAIRPVLHEAFLTGWTSTHHTGDLVELAMWGPGADLLPLFSENWQLHGVLRQVLSI